MPRLTIKQLMIGVALVAAALGIYRAFSLSSLILSVVTLSMSVAVGRLVREHPPVAPWLFSISTFLEIVPMALLCIYCYQDLVEVLLTLSGFAATAIGLGSGLVWACGRPAGRRWLRALEWLVVVVVGLMPLSIAVTPWPLRVAFAISRTSMERIADRVAAGGVVATPEWAGVFEIVEAVRDPTSGNIALLIDANPSGRAGFVRVEPGQPAFGPLTGFNGNEPVGGSWRYQIED